MTAPAVPPAGATPTWPDLLAALLAGTSLTSAQTAWAMSEIMDEAASPAQMAGLVVALRAKGETADEVTGFVTAMLDHAARIVVPEALRIRAVDTCGTGGDRAHTVNLSTMAALVVAGAGVPVVKHGNRAASSACGSADLLAELGVVIDLPPAAAARCLAAAGAVFCFAPVFHPALRSVGPVRRDLGVQTIFNILGPLANPAQPGAQALGVADARLAPVMAQVLAARGTRGLVFRGDDGLDELTTATTSHVWVLAGDGSVREDVLDPAALGLETSAPDALRGADAAHNAAVTKEFLAGARGPVRDAVLLAAAASLVAAAGPADAPIGAQIAGELVRAAEVVDSGAAAAALDRWVDASRAA